MHLLLLITNIIYWNRTPLFTSLSKVKSITKEEEKKRNFFFSRIIQMEGYKYKELISLYCIFQYKYTYDKRN